MRTQATRWLIPGTLLLLLLAAREARLLWSPHPAGRSTASADGALPVVKYDGTACDVSPGVDWAPGEPFTYLTVTCRTNGITCRYQWSSVDLSSLVVNSVQGDSGPDTDLYRREHQWIPYSGSLVAAGDVERDANQAVNRYCGKVQGPPKHRYEEHVKRWASPSGNRCSYHAHRKDDVLLSIQYLCLSKVDQSFCSLGYNPNAEDANQRAVFQRVIFRGSERAGTRTMDTQILGASNLPIAELDREFHARMKRHCPDFY
jgi:hypothetical protein